MRLLSPARERPKDRYESKSDKAAKSAPVKMSAPVMGWVENQSLAAEMPNAARVLENWFPTMSGVRVRGGAAKSATIGTRCKSLFSYQTATVSKLFASSASAIYDISALNPSSVPSASVSGLTSGYFSTEQMGTVGGEYLYAVNGTDSARLFDGSTWTTITGASTPAITGVTTSTLSYVWKHKNRLWFVKKNSKSAYYLPVDAVGGAAAEFSLAGVFQKGGYLLFGCTWSEDAGDGMDDRIVFVSSEGEVAVYQGTDPSSGSTWGIVGLYSMAPPRGPKCFIKAGGDVIIGTDDGAIPLSAVTTKDPAALSTAAVSAKIETSWRKMARTWDGVQPWEMIKWPAENLLLVTLPHDQTTCFVANVQTGAWAKYVGWDVQCVALFNKKLYFADKNGFVYAAEQGGSDNGVSYVSRMSYMPTDLGSPTAFKSVGLMRGVFQALGTPTVQLSLSVNYDITFPSLPAITSTAAGAGALWDAALWDAGLWDDDGLNSFIVKPTYDTGWVGVGAQGESLAPQVQIVTSGTGRPDIELVQIDLMGESGASVV